MKRISFALCVSLLTLGATSGLCETTQCTPITAIPATISTQGIYCLTGNVSTAATSGNAISISANNVTLDLNGWKVGGQAAGNGTAALGIFSDADNVTVKNGIVRGFYAGVYLTGRGSRVEGLLVDQNTYTGIYVQGQGAVVRNNQIVDTGGSTTSTDFPAYSIYVQSPGSVIEDNIISGITATGTGLEVAIYLYNTAGRSVVRRNVVSDSVRAIGSSMGIYVAATNVIVVGNNVINFDNGIDYYLFATGKYAQNVVVDCDTPYSGGTAGSDND